MKKLLLLCLFMLLLQLPINADVLIEPWGDEFYKDHQEEMEIEYRYYQTTEDLEVMISPVSDQVRGVVDDGHIIRVEFLYIDDQGTLWGMQVLKNDKGAWFKMDTLSAVKEHNDFMGDHPELEEINKKIEIDGNGYFIFWQYPGSVLINSSSEAYWTKDETYPMYISYEYIDEQGNLWVYVPQWAGQSGWINTNAELVEQRPSNTAVSRISNSGTVEPTPAATPVSTPAPSNSSTPESQPQQSVEDGSLDMFVEDDCSSAVLISALVIGVCTLTGVIAILQYRKRNK